MPALLPVTTPLVLIVATTGVGLIAQTPPAGVLFSDVVEFTQVAREPVIAVGSGFTVTIRVLAQPVPNV